MTTRQPIILKHASIIRKPHSAESSRRFQPATDAVKMHTGYTDSERRQLWLAFTASASGDGYTDYRVEIDVAEYATIIKAMCNVDREAALLAAASVLVPHLTAIKEERDAERARKDEERAKRLDGLVNLLAQSR